MPQDHPQQGTDLLSVRGLSVHFPVRRRDLFRRTVGVVRAVDGVDLSVAPGAAVGLVGESGCGKSTLARAVLWLQKPTAGQILIDGQDVHALSRARSKALRRRVSAVFQDPMSSLNPRMTVEDIIAEPMRVHGTAPARERRERVLSLLDYCGLPRRFAELYPHEMSGGQRQRVGIARALVLKPELLVCDEALSALDVSIQAQVMNLLARLRRELGIALLFIGHDLSVVRYLCDRVAVMYLGRVVEEADSEALFSSPRHPYTRALIDAVPVPDPVVEQERAHRPLPGEPPSPMRPPPGCRFHPRCPVARPVCGRETPPLAAVASGQRAACLAAMSHREYENEAAAAA